MLMRVEVRRCTPHQPLEPLQLAVDLGRHRRRVVRVGALVAKQPLTVAKLPLGQVDVQAQRQRGVPPGDGDRRLRSRLAHHQAGAGDDAVHVAVQDALVDAVGQAEIVGIDDQRPHSPSRSTIRATSPRQSWRCSGGGCQPSHHPLHCAASNSRARSMSAAAGRLLAGQAST